MWSTVICHGEHGVWIWLLHGMVFVHVHVHVLGKWYIKLIFNCIYRLP